METRPIYNDQGDLIDIQVSAGRPGSASMNHQDYIEQPDGTFTHVYRDVQLESDLDDQSTIRYKSDEYISALAESEPDLIAATRWCEFAPEITDDVRETWNRAIADGNDLDTINELAEYILEQYRSSDQYNESAVDPNDDGVESDDMTATEEWYADLSDEFIDNAVESIVNTEYDYQDVQIMSELSAAYQDDSAEGAILNYGIAIANGEIDASQAIEYVTEQFGEAEAARAYVELTQVIRNY